jgi:hypothetical protein
MSISRARDRGARAAAVAAMAALTDEQVEFFVEHNWLKADDVVPKSLCAEWVAAACLENGIDLDDSATWPHRNNFISAGLSGEMAQLAPTLYSAIVQLVGGPERLLEPALQLDSGLVANWDRGADSPWVEPGFANEYEWKSGGECGGWHADGDFNHFLDSPEAGLQIFILWDDVEYQAGPTYIAPESPLHLTRVLLVRNSKPTLWFFLQMISMRVRSLSLENYRHQKAPRTHTDAGGDEQENPGGLSACALGGGAAMCSLCHLSPALEGSAFCCAGCEADAKTAGWTEDGLPPATIGGWPADLQLPKPGLGLDGKTGSHNVQTRCEVSMPLLGSAGTVYFVHPQMLHTSSQNMKRVPRFMRNLQIPLKEPRSFLASALSPVERCILCGKKLPLFSLLFPLPIFLMLVSSLHLANPGLSMVMNTELKGGVLLLQA